MSARTDVATSSAAKNDAIRTEMRSFDIGWGLLVILGGVAATPGGSLWVDQGHQRYLLVAESRLQP